MTAARASWRPAPARPGMPIAEHRAWAAAVAVLDRIAADMEQLWGVGRLETLVSPEMAAKFARARQQCDDAISSGDIEAAAQKAAALGRGWVALDAEARALGHTPGDTGVVWCTEVGGRAYVVCLHTVDVAGMAGRFPDHTAVSLQELLRLLAATEAGRLVARVKDVFPGSAVTAIKPSSKPPAKWATGDELPF